MSRKNQLVQGDTILGINMEATPEQAAEGLIIVQVLAAVLERLIATNASISLADPGKVTKFHAMKAPGISIQSYLERYVDVAMPYI